MYIVRFLPEFLFGNIGPSNLSQDERLMSPEYIISHTPQCRTTSTDSNIQPPPAP